MNDTPASTVSGLPQAHAELARIVLGTEPLGAVLTRVARVAEDLIPAVHEVSITLVERDKARTVAFSGDRAVALDERQYQDGYGPCLDAAVTGEMVEVPDTSDESIYPDFARQAARSGIRHSLSMGLPTVIEGQRGALNLYGAGEPLDATSRELAVSFASYVAVAVTNASVLAGALAEVEQMRQAMASRSVIEQAKGIIMAGRRCTADEAFDLLREASSRANRKLRDIAQSVVDGVTE
jgi:GAF domain-containing protein